MGMQTKTVGQSPATGLGNDWAKFLQGGISGTGFGTPGQSPFQRTQGVAGVLNDLFSAGGGQVGGAMSNLLQQQQTRNLNSINARFSSGGMGSGFGSGNQQADALYLAQSAPQITTAINQMQMGGLNSIMPYINSIAGKGLPQTQTITQPSPLAQGLGIAAGLAGPIIGALAPTTGGGNLTPGGAGTDQWLSQMYSMTPSAIDLNGPGASGGSMFGGGGQGFGSQMSGMLTMLPYLMAMAG